MRGLSLIMKGQGFKVQGSDLAKSKNVFIDCITISKNQYEY